jgi:hypothetical protein
MAGIGIVNNPRARRNLRSPGTARRLSALLDGEGEVADASTREELDRVVSRFRACGIDVLGVNGGDGTGHVVLTAFASAYGAEKLPAVVLLRSGAMNTVADSHRLRGSPESILRALLERRRSRSPCRAVERDLLAVEADGGGPMHGFLFGTGAVVAFLDAYYRSGHPAPATAAALLVRAVGSALVGGCRGNRWARWGRVSCAWCRIVRVRPVRALRRAARFFHRRHHRIGAPDQPRASGSAGLETHAGARRSRATSGSGPGALPLDGDLYQARESVRIRPGPPIRLLLP